MQPEQIEPVDTEPLPPGEEAGASEDTGMSAGTAEAVVSEMETGVETVVSTDPATETAEETSQVPDSVPPGDVADGADGARGVEALRNLICQVPELTAECLHQLDVLEAVQQRLPGLRDRCRQLADTLGQVRDRLVDQLCEPIDGETGDVGAPSDGAVQTGIDEATPDLDAAASGPSEDASEMDMSQTNGPQGQASTEQAAISEDGGPADEEGIDILDGETMEDLQHLHKAAEENYFAQDPAVKAAVEPDVGDCELAESSEEMIEDSQQIGEDLKRVRIDPETAVINKRRRALEGDVEEHLEEIEAEQNQTQREPKLLEEMYPDPLGAMDYPTQVALARLDRGAQRNNFVEMENTPDDLELIHREVEASEKSGDADDKTLKGRGRGGNTSRRDDDLPEHVVIDESLAADTMLDELDHLDTELSRYAEATARAMGEILGSADPAKEGSLIGSPVRTQNRALEKAWLARGRIRSPRTKKGVNQSLDELQRATEPNPETSIPGSRFYTFDDLSQELDRIEMDFLSGY